MVDPDLALVEATARGDHETFESLVKRYQGPLLNFITRVGDRYLAKDITQEAFLRIYRATPRFQAKATFGIQRVRRLENPPLAKGVHGKLGPVHHPGTVFPGAHVLCS